MRCSLLTPLVAMVLLVLLVPTKTFTLIFDLAVATGTILVMLAAGLTEWRRRPYTHCDFAQAMERICDGVEELWRLQDEALFGTPQAALNCDGRSLRLRCTGLLQDMLRNTFFILNRAEPCCRSDAWRRIEQAEINRRAAEVVRQGTSLVFRLRWAQIRLAFRRDNDALCALAAEAAENYACLWTAVVRFLEAKFPERSEQLALAR